MGNNPYSPELHHNAITLLLWNKIIQRLQGRNINYNPIQKLIEVTGLQIDQSTISMEQATLAQSIARKVYKNAKRQSGSMRTTWLANLAQARAEYYGKEAEKRSYSSPLEKK